MKNIKFILMTTLLILQVSCGVDDKLFNELSIAVSPDFVISKTQISIVDAKPESGLFPTITDDVNITFTNPVDAENIYTVSGDKPKNDSYTIKDGVIILGVSLSADDAPTVSNPKIINVDVSKSGYITQNVDFVFTGADINAFQVKLISKNVADQPTGVDLFTISPTTLYALDVTNINSASFIGVQNVSETIVTPSVKFTSLNRVLSSGSSYLPTNSWISTLSTETSINSQTDVDAAVASYIVKFSVDQSVVYVATANSGIKLYDDYSFKVDGAVTGLGAGEVVVNSCNVDDFSGINLINNGLAGKFRYSIIKDGIIVGSENFSMVGFSTKSVSVNELLGLNFEALNNLLSGGLDLKIEAYSFDDDAWVSVLNQADVTLCTLSDLNITNQDDYTTEVGDIDLNIKCENISVSLNNTMLEFKESGTDIYRPFGVIKNGFITDAIPVLNDEITYVFRVWYDEYRESLAVLGSSLKENPSILITDEVCDEIEEQF